MSILIENLYPYKQILKQRHNIPPYSCQRLNPHPMLPSVRSPPKVDRKIRYTPKWPNADSQ